MKKHGRTDDNQQRIVQALRASGANVMSLAAVGNGCPDLLVHRGDPRAGQLYMLEIKDGDKPKSRRRLTPHQVRFHKDWPVIVVKSVSEALTAVGLTASQE